MYLRKDRIRNPSRSSGLLVGIAGEGTLSMCLSCWRSAELMKGVFLLWIGDESKVV
jgi:hypothetical protein